MERGTGAEIKETMSMTPGSKRELEKLEEETEGLWTSLNQLQEAYERVWEEEGTERENARVTIVLAEVERLITSANGVLNQAKVFGKEYIEKDRNKKN